MVRLPLLGREKPDRNRDMEFLTEPGDTRESRMEHWEAGWRCLFETLERPYSRRS
ncbi:MAG: DUF1572 family protein [Acidobacteria bacterium]|nr:DUF1572 family protein [Acidobacteriota bacterium]